jgi:hypothetical protein
MTKQKTSAGAAEAAPVQEHLDRSFSANCSANSVATLTATRQSSHPAMRAWTRKQREKQEDIWIAHPELASAPGHPFYQKLNELLPHT